MKKTVVLLFALLLGLTSCRQRSTSSINETIAVNEFEKKLSSDRVQLVDVRTSEEFLSGHIKGATNIDIHSDNFISEIKKLDTSKPVLVYCLSGGRSSTAAADMEEAGFKAIYNLAGGILKWNAAGKPLVTDFENASQGMSMEDFNKQLSIFQYVLVDFNAKWCEPCKIMAPMLHAFAKQNHARLGLLKIDAAQNKNLLLEKHISALPYLELYKDGKLVWKHSGIIDENTLRKETNL